MLAAAKTTGPFVVAFGVAGFANPGRGNATAAITKPNASAANPRRVVAIVELVF
jgi:hypothetical protein